MTAITYDPTERAIEAALSDESQTVDDPASGSRQTNRWGFLADIYADQDEQTLAKLREFGELYLTCIESVPIQDVTGIPAALRTAGITIARRLGQAAEHIEAILQKGGRQ